jgi:hypothetical protein
MGYKEYWDEEKNSEEVSSKKKKKKSEHKGSGATVRIISLWKKGYYLHLYIFFYVTINRSYITILSSLMKEWLCNFIWNIFNNKGCYLQKVIKQ